MNLREVRRTGTLVAVIALAACGGGGGGGSSTGPAPIVYSGNLNAAVITRDSGRTLAADVTSAGAASVIIAGVETQGRQGSTAQGPALLAPRINRILREELSRILPRARAREAASEKVQETDPCLPSGTVSFSGTLSDTTGTGTLSVTFSSCNSGNSVLDGPATFRIDAADDFTGLATDSTTSFSALRVQLLATTSFPGFQPGAVLQDVTAGGSLRSVVSISTNLEQLSGSLVTRDNASGVLRKADPLALTLQYNSIFSQANYTLSISNTRVFDSLLGFVDSATTTTPWFFANLDQIFPSSGGALILTGAQNAQVAVTPVSDTQAKIDLDLDANGTFELSATMPWTGIAPPAVNTAPVADAGADQAVLKGIPLTLGGSATDVDNDFITLQWSIAQKPNGSNAQLSGATTAAPSFTPDLAGTYVATLVANDGKLDSAAASVTVTATNVAPVAKAVPAFMGFLGAQAVFDGSQSTDANNDALSYAWTLVLRPQGSSAALAGANTVNPSLTLDALGIYRLSLVVNDGTVDSQAFSIIGYAVPAPTSTPQHQVPGDFATIQAAIDAANPGDVIAVAPGTYTGNLRFNGKDVTLRSTAGPGGTIIAGNGDTAVQIGPNGAIVGFTIRDGIGSFGGGLAVAGVGTVIRNNVFVSNTQTFGGAGAAIFGNVASPVIDANVFLNNSCQNDTQTFSGVISFFNGSSPTITNNIVENNPCRAINLTFSSGPMPQVVNNTIVANRAGVHLEEDGSVVNHAYRNNVIVGNDVGLEWVGGATIVPTWQNNLVFGNGTNYSGIADQTGSAGNISVDPQLVDQVGGNYYPNAGSPLIDAGIGTGAPTNDFLGRPRPVDGDGNGSAVPDIGAFELQP